MWSRYAGQVGTWGERIGWGALGVLTFVALRRYRAWHLHWGATASEVGGPMPGDDLLSSAQFVATRAITIDAAPDQVWPWLVQVGFGRAGFYSYDWVDNLGRPSATTILPEFQRVSPGDLAAPMTERVTPETAFRVAEAEAPRTLVWAKPDSTWAWRLTPEAAGGTRLVTRLKARYEPVATLPVTVLLMEVADFPMMRRMLLGIAARASLEAQGSHGRCFLRLAERNRRPTDVAGHGLNPNSTYSDWTWTVTREGAFEPWAVTNYGVG